MEKSVLNVFKKKLFLLLAVAVTISSTSFGVGASANNSNLQEEQVKQTLERINLLNETTLDLSDEDSEELKTLFLRDLSNDVFDIHTFEENLNFENAKGLEIVVEDGAFKTITVPIVGEEYNMFSNFTVVYDSDNNVVNYQETWVTRSDRNTFEFTSYADGDKVSQNISDVEYVSNEQIQEELDSLEEVSMVQSRGVAKIAACLASVLGVGGTVGYIIAGMCAGSCLAVPPVCAACVAAYATIGGASIAAVMGCFNL